MPSVKNIEKVKELSSSFQKAKAIYFTEYQGLNVEQITRLRSMFFKENVATHYHIRNGARLIKINPTTQNFEYKI